jgi:hypothetical protein
MTTAVASLALVVTLAMAAAAPALAQSDQETSVRLDALFGAHEPYEAFLATLKDAIAAKDKRAVAAMIAYPLETRIAGARVTLGSAEDLVRRYDRLFPPPVVAAIEGQTYATLFATAEGRDGRRRRALVQRDLCRQGLLRGERQGHRGQSARRRAGRPC